MAWAAVSVIYATATPSRKHEGSQRLAAATGGFGVDKGSAGVRCGHGEVEQCRQRCDIDVVDRAPS